MKKITIFTPAYNRAYTLPKLYESIKKQKYENFEWVIVDDGSKDNTKEIIDGFIAEKKVDIKYFYQENNGKHIAINKGVNEATGELFFIVDSDDYISENALESIAKMENTLKETGYIGVSGVRVYENGQVIGKTFDNTIEYVDATSIDREKYNIVGDKSEVFYTEILKKYKFPKIENENFLTEGYIWNKIARDGLKFRWFNEPLIICEYLEDGLSRNFRKIVDKNPKGQLLFFKDCIEFETDKIKKIKNCAWYVGIAKNVYTKKEIKEQININEFEFWGYRILFFLRDLVKGRAT